MQTHAIQPIQQFRYTTGKNATDSAMIIDAWISFIRDGDAFCLVSSEQRLYRMATRKSRTGLFCYGISVMKPHPVPLSNACDLFIYTENLVPSRTNIKKAPEQPPIHRIIENSQTPPIQSTSDAEKRQIHPTRCRYSGVLFDLAPVITMGFLGIWGHHLAAIGIGF